MESGSEMKKRESVNIFMLIDALGWDYIKDRSFLDDIAVTKKPVKSILGFSSGVIPSILTGKYPQEHKHWSLYYYSPQTSPFRWTKGLLWLPKRILNSRITRKIVEEISKRIMGYSGYFETYVIPVEQLHLFDICENKNIYAPKGIRGAESIFDILQNKNIDHKCFSYPLKDAEILSQAKSALESSKNSFYFLYLSESDALLHSLCRNQEQVKAMVDYYEKEIRELYQIAGQKFNQVNLFVFSDHSMAPVNKAHDLKKDIEELGFSVSKDYIPLYDSTMARFWFFNHEAKETIVAELNKKEYGRILSKDELKAYGCYFEDERYGQIVFLMNTGAVINPSFMGSNAPEGMHGFGVDDGAMDAMLVSNQKVEREIKDVKDFFQIMVDNTIHDTHDTTRKTKVLYFLNSTIRAGAEEHVLQLIKHLDRERFEPILVCPQKLIDLLKENLEAINVRFYPVHIRRWRNIKEIARFLTILKEEKPDIVHSHLSFATRFAAVLAKVAGVPKVIETAHIREAWRKGIKKAYFIDRFFCRFVDKVIAVSAAVKGYLIAEKKIPTRKVEVIRNGVDTERFKPFESTNGKKEFCIGVIGRLEPQKGHKYFLEAVSMLDGKFDNTKFLIVGEGSLREELQHKCQELKIDDRVEFLGFKKDMVSVFGDLDLIVLPSLYEGLPLVALEAGAMGKAIIVTNVDGSPEVVINNKTGFIVPSKNSAALKNAVETFLNNRNLAAEFGENSRKHIKKEFELAKQVTKTEQLYNAMAFNG